MESWYNSTLSLTSAPDGCGWSTPRPGRFTSGKETRYPLYRRLGGPQGQSGWVEKLGHHRGSIPDRPARSKSLYQLSHPGPRHSILRVLYERQCFCSFVSGQYKTICPLTAVCHQLTRHHSKTTCSRRVHAEQLSSLPSATKLRWACTVPR